MTLRTLLSALFVPVFAFGALGRNLDYIDADGVTETGGPGKGRMLPRTGTNGVLHASLLPPLSDWASQPIPGLYYVAQGAAAGGNGSPQYPFASLTDAAAHALPGSALVLAPGSYAGSLTIAQDRSLTLCGFGRATVISSLAVTLTGAGTRTELRLCGLRADTVSVTGGTGAIRLAGSTVGSLTGTATVTLLRTDLAAKADSILMTGGGRCTDAYVGHPTAPQALALLDTADGAADPLVLADGRPAVGPRTLVFTDELAGATNAVRAELARLEATNGVLAARIAAEALARAQGDAAVRAELDAAVTDLERQIDDIGDGWFDQVATLRTNLANTRASLEALYGIESNDVERLTTAVAGVRTGYQSADATLRTQLRGEIGDRVSALHTVVSDEIATGVQAAKDYAKDYTDALEEDVDEKYEANLEKITALQTWQTGVNTTLSGLGTTDGIIKAKINEIITALGAIKAGKEWTVPTPFSD